MLCMQRGVCIVTDTIVKCKHSAFDKKWLANENKERAAKGWEPMKCSCFRTVKPKSEIELRSERIARKIQKLLAAHY